MIRSCSLCARGVMARGCRYRLVGNRLAHDTDKITTSYQAISTRRQSRFAKKTPSKVKSKAKKKVDINTLFKPVSLSFPEEGAGAGIEIAGPMEKAEVEGILKKFYRKGEIRILAAENGLEGSLFEKVFLNFEKYCLDLENLSPEIYILLKDISQGAGHPDDIFPYFLDHAKNIFPHLSCMEELKKISDLTTPANWYPEARSRSRKIIYHAGPTNSGKTYHAIKRMFEAKSGLYCAPLKLLANEISHKSNTAGTPCDLVTGEERRYAIPENPSAHLACTIEMASVTNSYEVAVIDEIQMIQDVQRGWAWTRALLGLNADEIHLCGEESGINLVKQLLADTTDKFEVKHYKRLSPLNWSTEPLGTISNVKPGDCIVCFSKRDIYALRTALERSGVRCAVLYGSLPPGAKLAEASRFNDPDNICKVLVATDAIGMGVNLSVKRVIFHKLVKRTINRHGENEIEDLTTSQLLQIGGRAGRYGMEFDQGEVTTFKPSDIQLLHKLKSQKVEPIKQAGLHPTAEQIETFAFHLPGSTLSELIQIFEGICQLDGEKFFMCITDSFKMIAKMTEHIPLPLKTRYVICMSPLNTSNTFLTSMILKFARRISNGEGVRVTWFRLQINWPYTAPKSTKDLEFLENVYDAMDLYLWLSYRFVDMFPDVHHIRDMREEVDLLIQNGVKSITKMTTQKPEIKIGKNDPEVMTENMFVEDNMENDETVDADESFKEFDKYENVTTENEFDDSDTEINESFKGEEGFRKTYTPENVTAEKVVDDDYNKLVRDKEEKHFSTSVVTPNNTKNAETKSFSHSSFISFQTTTNHSKQQISSKGISSPLKYNEPKREFKNTFESRIQNQTTTVPYHKQNNNIEINKMSMPLKPKEPKMKFKKTIETLMQNKTTTDPYEEQDDTEMDEQWIPPKLKEQKMKSTNKDASLMQNKTTTNRYLLTDIKMKKSMSKQMELEMKLVSNTSTKKPIDGELETELVTNPVTKKPVIGVINSYPSVLSLGSNPTSSVTYKQQDNIEIKDENKFPGFANDSYEQQNDTERKNTKTQTEPIGFPEFAGFRSDTKKPVDGDPPFSSSMDENKFPGLADLRRDMKITDSYEQLNDIERTNIGTPSIPEEPGFADLRSDQKKTDFTGEHVHARRIRGFKPTGLRKRANGKLTYPLFNTLNRNKFPEISALVSDNQETSDSADKGLYKHEKRRIMGQGVSWGSETNKSPSKDTKSQPDSKTFMVSEPEHQDNNKRKDLNKPSLFRQKYQIKYKTILLHDQYQQQNIDEMKESSIHQTETVRKDDFKVEDKLTNANVKDDGTKKTSVLDFIQRLFTKGEK